MQDARPFARTGTARWVEVCYCPTPLQEERPYWEQYFELVKVQDGHDRPAVPGPRMDQRVCERCDCTEGTYAWEHQTTSRHGALGLHFV